MKFTKGLTGLAAVLAIAACASGTGPEASPENRQALNDQMLQQDTLSSGFIPSQGPISSP
jgi:hypothetical protein